MTTTEILLVVALLALTSVLTAVGVQLYMLIVELRQTVVRVNTIIDTTEERIDNVVRPLQQIGSAMVGVKSTFRIFDAVTGWLNTNQELNKKD